MTNSSENTPYAPNFLQSKEWAKTNELIGHKVIWAGDTLTIVKSARRGRYLEVPGCPKLPNFAKISKIATDNNCVFVRFRFQLPNTAAALAYAKRKGLKKAPMHLHAEHTVIINLEKSEQDLLAAMRRQTRYEVRRADKQGIIVEKSTSKEIFEEFHQVQVKTAARQHFVPPDEKTLMAEHQAFGENAVIYIAKTQEGEPIAYGLILKSGDEAEYFEAASTLLGRATPGAYALLWRAMRDLKAEGYKRFNLWGIAPPNQPHHRYAGVTTFKTGFGGDIVEFLPAQDLVINKAKYCIDLIIEKTRKKVRHL